MLLALAAIAGGFVLGVHRPAIAEQSQLQSRIDMTVSAATALPRQLAELREIDDEIARRRDFLATHRLRLLTEAEASGLVQRLSATAHHRSLVDVRVEPVTGSEGTTYRTRQFRVTCRGPADSVVSYLGDIERAPLRATVDELMLRQADWSGAVTAAMTIELAVADDALWETLEADDLSVRQGAL